MEKKEQSSKFFFDKSVTNYLKGLTVVIMFAHHFFFFSGWWLEGIDYPLCREYENIMRTTTNICVYLFAFVSGYLYFFSSRKLSYSIKKISDYFLQYWVIYVIFAIGAVILVKYPYTLIGVIKELLAWQYNTVCLCWYMYFYGLYMLVLPLLTKLETDHFALDFLVLVCIPTYLFEIVKNMTLSLFIEPIAYNFSVFFLAVLVGFLFAKYNIVNKAVSKICDSVARRIIAVGASIIIILLVPLILNYSSFVIVMIGNQTLPSGLNVLYLKTEALVTPVLVIAFIVLRMVCYIKPIDYILLKIGEKSLMMWLISSIFFSNMKQIFQPILYLPKFAPLVLIWGLALCYFAALGFDYLTKPIIQWKNKVFFGIK